MDLTDDRLKIACLHADLINFFIVKLNNEEL